MTNENNANIYSDKQVQKNIVNKVITVFEEENLTIAEAKYILHRAKDSLEERFVKCSS